MLEAGVACGDPLERRHLSSEVSVMGDALPTYGVRIGGGAAFSPDAPPRTPRPGRRYFLACSPT
ncbi:hypothetical protein GCM10010433_37790 [Streptomyces pulveraceus]